MTDFLAEIPRWLTNLVFWIALLSMIGCAWGVYRSFKGYRAELDTALNELYALLDEARAERDALAPPPSAPLPPSGNVRDIPTTRTAVARTDEAVEGLKATIGLPTDPNKIPHQAPAPTEAIPALSPGDTVTTRSGYDATYIADDAARIGDNIPPGSWAYVLSPDHKLEIAEESGRIIPAFRDPALDFPTEDQQHAPTNPDLRAVPGLHLSGATRLIPTGGRHRHPEDDE